MSKKSLATGVSPFAHLMSGFRGAKRAEEDDPKDPDAEDQDPENPDDPDAEEPEEQDEPEGKRARRARRARKAEDEDEDQDPEADDGDDDDIDAEEDMDEDERKAFRRGVALGRKRENTRCARIFSSTAAGPRPDLAATLAFTTRNSSAEASRLMGAVGSGATRGRGLDSRMSGRTEARPGADTSGGAKPSFGERVKAARQKAGR